MKKNKFYITTSIAYTNAEPHIGYALELSQADVLARYHAQKGESVYFLTGTDEHGIKIARAAKDAGMEPKQFVDKISGRFQELDKALNVSNNDFIRTTDQVRHWPAVIKIWNTLQQKGDLYKKEYEGLYCVGHEAFIKKSELIDGLCPLHKTAPEKIKEENWFFKLTQYKDQIKELIASDKLKIVPETRKNEILNLFNDAEDVSFSRPTKDLTWGIPVPGDSTQTMYVWADALTNYISALGYAADSEDFQQYWPANVHLIGKDILRFHAMIWPAMLISAGLELPEAIYVHGFINIDGQKMSKSLGNVVDPFGLIEKYGSEVVRYFLLREIPSGDDGDFSIANLESRYNSDLANGLGNFTARVLALVAKQNLDGSEKMPQDLIDQVEAKKSLVEAQIAQFRLHDALATIWALISVGDTYINKNEVWKSKDPNMIFGLLKLLESVTDLIAPFMPETSAKIKKGVSKPLFPRM